MDTLLSHEATGENLWMAEKQHNCRSHDNDNMTNVLRPDYIYTSLKEAHTQELWNCGPNPSFVLVLNESVSQ